MDLVTILEIGSAFVVGLITRDFLPSYWSEKGKNLATKEDIQGITRQIESVKHEYAETQKRNGFRYEKEYTVLSILTANLVEVRDAALSLRPIAEFVDPSISDEERKEKKLRRLYEAGRQLYKSSEEARPFYSVDIYKVVGDLNSVAQSESVRYEVKSPFDAGQFKAYWEEAKENQKKIVELANQAMEVIRVRVSRWTD